MHWLERWVDYFHQRICIYGRSFARICKFFASTHTNFSNFKNSKTKMCFRPFWATLIFIIWRLYDTNYQKEGLEKRIIAKKNHFLTQISVSTKNIIANIMHREQSWKTHYREQIFAHQPYIWRHVWWHIKLSKTQTRTIWDNVSRYQLKPVWIFPHSTVLYCSLDLYRTRFLYWPFFSLSVNELWGRLEISYEEFSNHALKQNFSKVQSILEEGFDGVSYWTLHVSHLVFIIGYCSLVCWFCFIIFLISTRHTRWETLVTKVNVQKNVFDNAPGKSNLL